MGDNAPLVGSAGSGRRMLGSGRRGQAFLAALGVAGLCVVAAAMALRRNGSAALEDLSVSSSGRPAAGTEQLYQIGDQEYLALKTGSVEDMADEVGKKLGKELIMLKKIEKAAAKGKRVFVSIEAGQVGTRGRPGPKGYTGPVGFQGPRGPRGYRGPQGPRGDTGPRGIKGVKGEDGDDGPHGDKGDTGNRGPPGPKGRRGREGRRGPEGSVGKNGNPGPPGRLGAPGPRGPAAADGLRGPQGPAGPPGQDGRNGDQGAGGDKGPPGPQGDPGSDGAAGPRGPKGDAGKSMCGISSQLGMKMCTGEIDAAAIKADSNYNHYLTVNMRKCKFTGQPTVFTSLSGSSNMWEESSTDNIITDNNVMNPTEFKLFIRTNTALSLGTIRSKKWKVRWVAFGESSMKPIPQQICCGSSSSGSWNRFDSKGIYTDVNTAGCKFKNTPYFFTSITDKACGSELLGSARCTAKATGQNGIYSSSKSGFRVYTQPFSGGTAFNYATARANGWQLNWCGISSMPPTDSGAAGYPCTSPRLLKGNNDNGVFSDEGQICCDRSTSGGWKQAGTRAISKEVDISACGFKKVGYTLLNVRGDSPLEMVSGSTSWAPTSDPTKIKVYLQTNGKYKFYNGPQYHWKVQYCIFGR